MNIIVISVPVSTKTEKSCTKGAVDVVFVVDESGSISGSDFETTMNFLAKLVNSLDIGPGKGVSYRNSTANLRNTKFTHCSSGH